MVMPTRSKLTTATRKTKRREDRLPPPHPGETIAEMIISNGLSAYRVASDIGVTVPRVNELVLGKRPVSAEMALRLGKYFGVTPEYLMNLQQRYELDTARDEFESELAAISKFNRENVEKVARPRTEARVFESPMMGRQRTTSQRPSAKAARAKR